MSATLRYLFSVPVHISLYFHVLFMLLSESDVHSVLISKHFVGGFSSLRNYKLKSVANITLRTLHIVHVRFFFYSACWRKFISYYSNSELDSDNSQLNTKLLSIDSLM